MISPVDVFIMTRNSGRFLDNCIKSIKKNVNINDLIIIDGNSIDNTINIAKSHNAKIYYDGGNGLGYARKMAIDLCETEWLCFVDSDVELPNNWHEKMMKYDKYNIGAIVSNTLNIPVNEYEKHITKIQNLFFIRNNSRIKELNSKISRGFTGATFIRRKLLQDLKMPQIRSEEDYVITQHIIKKAKWIHVPIFVKHYDRFSERPKRISHTWANARFLFRMNTIKFLIIRAKSLLKGFLFALIYNEPLYFVHYIRYAIHSFIGWLFWDEYIKSSYPIGKINIIRG